MIRYVGRPMTVFDWGDVDCRLISELSLPKYDTDSAQSVDKNSRSDYSSLVRQSQTRPQPILLVYSKNHALVSAVVAVPAAIAAPPGNGD